MTLLATLYAGNISISFIVWVRCTCINCFWINSWDTKVLGKKSSAWRGRSTNNQSSNSIKRFQADLKNWIVTHKTQQQTNERLSSPDYWTTLQKIGEFKCDSLRDVTSAQSTDFITYIHVLKKGQAHSGMQTHTEVCTHTRTPSFQTVKLS